MTGSRSEYWSLQRTAYTVSKRKVNISRKYMGIVLRRKILIKQLSGMTVSKDPESSELVIHVKKEHDLRLKSQK